MATSSRSPEALRERTPKVPHSKGPEKINGVAEVLPCAVVGALVVHALDFALRPSMLDAISPGGRANGGPAAFQFVGAALVAEALVRSASSVAWGRGGAGRGIDVLGAALLVLGAAELAAASTTGVKELGAVCCFAGACSAASLPLALAALAGLAPPGGLGRVLGRALAAAALAAMVVTGGWLGGGSVWPLEVGAGSPAPLSMTWRISASAVSYLACAVGALLMALSSVSKAEATELRRRALSRAQAPAGEGRDSAAAAPGAAASSDPVEEDVQSFRGSPYVIKQLFSIRGALLPLMLGIAISVAWSALGFQVALFDHTGHAAGETGAIVRVYLVASAFGAWAAGELSDVFVRHRGPGGRATAGLVALAVAVPSLGLFALYSKALVVGRMYALKVAGAAAIGASTAGVYAGAAKPLLLEAVPASAASMTVGLASAMELQVATCIGPVIVGLLAEGIFDYEPLLPLADEVVMAGRKLQNLGALSQAVYFVVAGALAFAFLLLATMQFRARPEEAAEAPAPTDVKKDAVPTLAPSGEATPAKRQDGSSTPRGKKK